MVLLSVSQRFAVGNGLGAVLLLALLGCDGSTAGPTTERPSASAPVAATSATTAPSASSAAAAMPHSGRWQGSYKAIQAAVTIPKGVKTATWKSDDGNAATGAGKVEITIDPTGQVTGKSSGPLGAMSVRGVFEDDTLRAGLTPTDPAEDGAMTGFLVGRPEGEAFVAKLRVSSRDAALVRSAEVRLQRP